MGYRVVITPEAQAAIDRDLARIRLQISAAVAERWHAGLTEAILSLSHMPTRCCVIPEGRLFEAQLRELLYGGRGHERRIVFFVEGDTVHVVHYRHGSLPPLSGPEDLGSLGELEG